MTVRLQGKIALVTGGSTGIGRATAMMLAREGAKVVIASRGADEAEDVVRAIRGDGGQARFIRTDVSRADDVATLIDDVVTIYGRLDCAVNNAGIEGMVAPLADQTEAAFDEVIDVNLKGVWLCMKYELARMMAQGGGAIVNVAGISGMTGSASASVYSASKHGVVGLTRSAAVEYARADVRVNAVCPGVVRTSQWSRVLAVAPVVSEHTETTRGWWSGRTPRGRVGKPEEVAEAIVWLCSDAASYVTGHALVVDGGAMAGH